MHEPIPPVTAQADRRFRRPAGGPFQGGGCNNAEMAPRTTLHYQFHQIAFQSKAFTFSPARRAVFGLWGVLHCLSGAERSAFSESPPGIQNGRCAGTRPFSTAFAASTGSPPVEVVARSLRP
jgi:hypothetical protein